MWVARYVAGSTRGNVMRTAWCVCVECGNERRGDGEKEGEVV